MTAYQNQEGERDTRHLEAGLRRVGKTWRRAGEYLFTGLTVALTVATAMAAYWNFAHKGWNSDAAAWVQAGGSIIAITGAAWLARSQSREARRWRREQGEEAAWAVRFVLVQAQFDAQIIAAELTKPDQRFDGLSIRSWRQRAANASLALQTMLTRVDHIHPAVILTASNAKVLVDYLRDDLAQLADTLTREQAPGDTLLADIVFVHRHLAELVEEYDARVRGILIALDRGRDMLPLNELTPWSNRPRA